LKFPRIISKSRATIFIIANIKIHSRICWYVYTKSHIMGSNYKLSIVIKQKDEYIFRAVAMLLFYIVQSYLKRREPYIKWRYDAPTSQVRTSSMLLLVIEEN